jgi:hypothetical protein
MENVAMSKGPKQVLIIRHGEKVGDPKKDDDGGNDLSIRGSARAAALPSLFVPGGSQLACEFDFDPPSFAGSYEQIPLKGPRPRFPTPQNVIATQQSKHSKRPIETVTPLAIALGLHVNDRFADTDADIKEMTDAILHNRSFADEIVLICWHHGKIPAIAKALGISKPPKWDGKIFDRVWQITFAKGKATLVDSPQMLLYGDSKK